MSLTSSPETDRDALVTKKELARLLRISRQTLDLWIERYGDEFPVLERGTNGREWQFDADLVIEFLRAKQAENAARQANRDALLDQLTLPIATPDTQAPGLSLDDRIKATRLADMQMLQAERAKRLVRAEPTLDLFITIFADLQRALVQNVDRLAREHAWPEPIRQAEETKMADLLRSAHATAKEFLTPKLETPDGQPTLV